MDELLPSPPRQRKRLHSPKPAANQRSRATKKVKTGLTPHNSFAGDPNATNVAPKACTVQKNALAGPSTQANASGLITQNLNSSRLSRPAAKKTTARIHQRAIVSGPDSDSDESFPSTILPKTPTNLKKRKLSSMSGPSPSKGYKARESKAQCKGKVVHLGAIELSSDSDYPIKPTKKRPKRMERKSSFSSDIIDLCSGPEESLSPLKTPTRTRIENNVVIILSSDDEGPPSSNLFDPGMDVDNQDNYSPMEILPEPQGTESRGSEASDSQEIPEAPLAASDQISSSQNNENPFDSLQLSLNEALKKAKRKSGDNGTFTAPTSARPSRIIIFPDNLPNPVLHTPLFFSRAITAAKTAVLASQKRAKKRRFQALLLASSLTNHETSPWTPPVKLCQPEASTLDNASSSLATTKDTVDHCAEPRATPPTSPEYTVPIRTELQEPISLAHPEILTGNDSGQDCGSGAAHVRSGTEKYTAETIPEDSFEGHTSGVASPSIGEGAPDVQRDVAEPVALNSVAMASTTPVLQSPSADILSFDESNTTGSLDGSGISLGEPDIVQPDDLPTTSQIKASRSISEIPEKTRSSAQCLIQVLNDFKISKKFVNATVVQLPPAVAVAPHVEGMKSIADPSPTISLNDSSKSDPSDTESPPPVTPPDSPDEPHAPILTKTISRPKTVSILDFDLNNLNVPMFFGNTKYDDDDDDLSLSGLELVYPDDVC